MAYSQDSWASLNLTREEVDRRFLHMMLVIAGDNRIQRARARLFYYLARIFGGPFWDGK